MIQNLELTRSQKKAYIKVMSGMNLFLTGVAGTGKTFFLNNLAKLTGKKVYLTASTGAASVQLENGRTVSSFLGLGMYNAKASFRCPVRLDDSILVIDEISMIGRPQWAYILKSIKKNCKDFRTVQIILSGDYAQMPPVYWDYPMDILYLAKADYSITGVRVSNEKAPSEWEAEFFNFVELEEIVRQKDLEFISKLMDIRFYGMKNHLRWLSQKSGNPEKLGITLVANRATMDRLNATVEKGEVLFICNLSRISDPDRPYTTLDVWRGMKVLLIHNNRKEEYVNGDTGIVQCTYGYANDNIVVKVDRTGKSVTVRMVSTEYPVEIFSHIDDDGEKIYTTEYRTYRYMPLLPAYYLTVRRAQGATLTYGSLHNSVLYKTIVQLQYTAISRFQSIENVHIMF